MPQETYAFGKLIQKLTYNADGTVATVADGKGNVTTLTLWDRGIPESIKYADASTKSADVSASGWVKNFSALQN